MEIALIPKIKLDALISAPSVTLVEKEAYDGNINEHELEVISKLVKTYKPKVLFEIGTFDGRTTINLLKNTVEDAIIYTLNLPENFEGPTKLPLYYEETTDIEGRPKIRSDAKYINKVEIGYRYKNKGYEKRIQQLFGDSAIFDFSPYINKIDFVFVDGSHAKDYVKHDSEIAYKILNSDGFIIWHDYGVNWKDVTEVLNKFYQEDPRFKNLVHIEETSFALLHVVKN
ncbi:MAG: class I SAM-dependent methyltransferase [Paludibacteraceae bacterium]|nr:class I SAM-dependent methyltransferase [Paludibacteraceae bacterium]